MRWEKLRLHNMGPFADAEIDLTRVDGTLIQLSGCNGAGKTTALELLPGALFRQCPTRGSIASLATARDSFVEVVACNGQRYTVRQSVDRHTGKGESLVTREDGSPVVESGKVRETDKWVASHFPSPDVLYSSSVSVQGRRGLLDMSSGERKAVLLRALGIERLERDAESARNRARAAKAHVEMLRARLADLEEHDLDALRTAQAEATSLADKAAESTRGARLALERAKAAADDAARTAEIRAQRAAVQKRIDESTEKRSEVELRLRNNRALLTDAEAIREAVGRDAELDGMVTEARAEADRAQAAHVEADRVAVKAEEAVKAARLAVSAAERCVEDLGKRLVIRDKVRSAAARETEMKGQEAALRESVHALEVQVADVEALVLGAKDQRIDGMRHGLIEIHRCEDNDAPFQVWAAHTLSQDDELAERAEEAPRVLSVARESLAGARAKLDAHLRAAAETSALAARLPEIEAVEREHEAAERELVEAKGALDPALKSLEVAARARSERFAEHGAATGKVGELLEQKKGLASLLKKAEPLASAEARIDELTGQLAHIASAIEAAEAELATLPDVSVEAVDLSAYERKVADAEQAEHTARARVTTSKDALQRAEMESNKRAELAREVELAEVEVSDWTRLGQDLGKDGLQALEIDAAIPELNTLANDLLEHCHGPRFTVEARAERMSADGKRSLEGLELRVIDTEKGRDALAESYSGGECVIVGEAISLALTMIACGRSGIERPTLLRDETGAALDEENGRAYSAMLRRAAQHVGADKVLVVAHGAWLEPDAVLRVSGGRIDPVSSAAPDRLGG